MSGIIKRWVTRDYLAVAWEDSKRRVTRLGFVHRQGTDAAWVPVVQHDELIPLDPTIGLTWAISQLLTWHSDHCNITRTTGDDCTYVVYRGLPV